MRLTLTNSSNKALQEIKEAMIKQFEEKNVDRFRLKFTKKKEFVAIPIAFTSPAFQLFINGKFHKTYFLRRKKWDSIS